jgi:hypothetical protein
VTSEGSSELGRYVICIQKVSLHLARNVMNEMNLQHARSSSAGPRLWGPQTGNAFTPSDYHVSNLQGTSWRWVISFTPRPFYLPGKSPRYPLVRRLGRPRTALEDVERRQILPLPGLEPRPLGRPEIHTHRHIYICFREVRILNWNKCICVCSFSDVRNVRLLWRRSLRFSGMWRLVVW